RFEIGGWHVRRNSSHHFAGRTDNRLACGTNRAGHRLWSNRRHCDRRRGSPDRKLVVASFRHPSWIRNVPAIIGATIGAISLAFDSQAGLSSRSLVINRREGMAVARTKRVTRRDWTRDEVKTEEALKRQPR